MRSSRQDDSRRTDGEYKDTPLGRIPVEWEVVKLGDFAYIKARIGWRGLKASEYMETGPFLIANKHINGSGIRWKECDHISQFRYDESHEIQLKNNDLIISKDGTIGRMGFIEHLPGLATINSTMMLVRSNNEMILYPKFLYYYLQGSNFQKLIKEKISGSSVPHLFQRDITKLKIPLISITEQRKIASILSTVDAAIAETDALIAKTEQVKRGLMQELLTKGIGHMEFKDTKLGLFPKDWDVKTLSEIPHSYKNGLYKKEEDYGSGYPCVRMYNISNGLINKTKSPLLRVSDYEFDTYQLKPGDLLINRVNSIDWIGKAGIVPNGLGKVTFESKNIRVRFDNGVVYPNYIRYFVQTSIYAQQIKSMIKAAIAQCTINQDDLDRLIIPLPSYDEQIRIADILVSLDDEIESERCYRKYLETMKKGLMQDLLIGKVRVKPEKGLIINA